MKTSWRPFSSSSSEDVFIKTNFVRLSLTSSEDVLVKTNIFVLAIRLQDVFKMFSRRLAKTSSRHLQDAFKTSCQDVFKMSSKRLEDIFKTSCKDVFKTFSRCIIELNCSCQHVFEMYLIHFWDLLQKRLYTEGFALVTLLRTLRSVCRICTSEKKLVKFSFSLCCTF